MAHTSRWRISAPVGVILCGAASGGDAVAQNGNGPYGIFNPTPDNRLREFSTDRPDLTEGPFTIDPGRVQLESDLFNYTRPRPDLEGTVTEKFLFGATTFRIGITRNSELGLVLQPYNAVRTRMTEAPGRTWNAGPDVFQIRPKINLWGNDTFEKPGATAFGIVPFLNIPTVRNGVGSEHVEGGVAFPFAYKVNSTIDIGVMTQFEYIRNESGTGYHAEYVNSGLISYQLNSQWTTYIEVFTRFGNESPLGGIVTVGGGFLYKLTSNLQLDFGVNFGVTRAADTINPFIGLSRRF